ncbi:MAG TPA: tRNA lysidine(34) synthetase TilS [Burkholderiaceae bacterium]|nr:tRNA lysidine(34) synthetase TilS [Burkholderiaceae bacterium]
MSQTFEAAMAAFTPDLPLTIAYSGGADSSALLLACAQKWPGQINAIHIHHGLQKAADDFEAHCVAFCKKIKVPLKVIKVDAKPAPGQSPEAAARDARYAAFYMENMAESGVFTAYSAINNIANEPLAGTSFALAQHADDQVETLLLALSRGAGLPGLAAMPEQWVRDGIQYHRPLLQVAAKDIRRWLATQTAFGPMGAPFVEDPTNTDESFTRNRIRAQLLPVLEAVFPQFRDTFTRSSGHAASAQTLLNQIASEDLHKTGTPPHIKQLQHLSDERMANVLRFWLKTEHQTTPSTAQLSELIAQVKSCTTRGHKMHIKIGQGFVERKAACIDWYNP